MMPDKWPLPINKFTDNNNICIVKLIVNVYNGYIVHLITFKMTLLCIKEH